MADNNFWTIFTRDDKTPECFWAVIDRDTKKILASGIDESVDDAVKTAKAFVESAGGSNES